MTIKSFKQFLLEEDAKVKKDPFGGNPQIKRIYGAIAMAEHEAAKIKDPYKYDERLFIRTSAGKGTSSAYGPVQITRNTARGFFKQNPKLFQGNEDYTEKFIKQGDKFLKSQTNDPTYGTGCVGDLCDEKYHEQYQELASSIIKGKAKEKNIDLSKPISDDDLTTFVGHWRGETETNDPRYYRAFRQAYKSFQDEAPIEIAPEKQPETKQQTQTISTEPLQPDKPLGTSPAIPPLLSDTKAKQKKKN